MALIDTHCHLDLYEQPELMLRHIEAARVYTIAVTNAPSVYAYTATIAAGTRFIRPAVGLHPEIAVARAAELPLFWRALETTRYVGEVGLDYTVGEAPERIRQRSLFEEILRRCNERGNTIVTIHSRRAADDVVDVIGEGFRGTPILHWYSGSARTLNRAMRAGCYISVNPAMVRSHRAIKMVANVPRERVLTESDGPFVRVDGRAATPLDMDLVCESLAKVWRVTAAEAVATVHRNFAVLLDHDSKGQRKTTASMTPQRKQ